MQGSTDGFLHFISINLLVLGGIVWGLLGLTEYNWLSRAARYLNVPDASRIIYIMIGFAALIYLMRFYQKDVLKARMNGSAFPPNLLNVGYPLDYDQETRVKAPNNASHAIYWTARGHEDVGGLDNEKKAAYGDYSNSGAVEVGQGIAKLKFRTPVSYGGKRPHVHYRWLFKSGKLSPLYTVKVS